MKEFLFLFFNSMIVCGQCSSNIVLSKNLITQTKQSSTWIKTSPTIQTTIYNSAIVKLDANPNNGYIELNPGFIAFPGIQGVFIAQALDGCESLKPAKMIQNIEVGKEDVEIYPNPIDETVNITFGNLNEVYFEFQIYDLTGKMLLNKKINSKLINHIIDVSDIPSGSYVYKLISKNKIETGIILKK